MYYIHPVSFYSFRKFALVSVLQGHREKAVIRNWLTRVSHHLQGGSQREEASPSVLLRPPTDWLRSTHNTEGSLLQVH